MSIPFGEYKGQQLDQLPIEYVVWLAGFDNTISLLAETVMLNKDYDTCAKWISNSGVETTEECEAALRQSFEQGIFPICVEGPTQSWWKVYTYHKPWIYRARDTFRARGICRICFKRLVPIGNARINGRPHGDWGERTMHKSCWRSKNNEWF